MDDFFCKWTSREVDIALRKIKIRHHNNRALNAAIHGVKMELKGLTPPPVPSSNKPVDSTLVENALKAALERKRKEMNG